MTVTPAQAATLRAALVGDDDAFNRLSTDPDVAKGEGFPILAAAAFAAAAQRRFPPGWSGGDVVRFVGHLRARSEGAYENLSATAAEQMLLSILRGEPMDGQFDDFMKGYAQFALLAELVRDLSEQELSTFLAEAREQADTWLAQHGDQLQAARRDEHCLAQDVIRVGLFMIPVTAGRRNRLTRSAAPALAFGGVPALYQGRVSAGQRHS